MAAAQKIITVDLGTSTIKFAEFGLAKGGALTLLRFGVAELGLDPNKEEERAGFIAPTLAKLFADNGLKPKGKEILLSISGQSVFMRFVKLPPVDPAQVDQVVSFEAQQNVPFPINEVTWDYQMMPNRGTGVEAEAVIVAIKKEVLEAEVAAIESIGVQIKRVDVAPFALLNAFRYSEPPSDECAIIIDMGARSTNLVFVEKSSFWIRNIPIAGNQISQSICNELQEPFIAAETLKKGKGFVSLGGVYADPDDADAARISKLIRSTLTRLHVDINRSIAFYRTTLNGSAPKKVYLIGGTSQLPYLDLFIADKLSLPVVYFNPLRNVTLGKSLKTASLQQQHCYTAELVGLALRETGSCPAEVVLDAPSLAARADKRRKIPYFFTALFVWVLLFVCLGLYYYQQTLLTGQVAQKLRDNTQSLHTLAPAIGKLAKDEASLQATFDLAAQLGNDRDAWPKILDTLNAKIPAGLWITDLAPAASSETGGQSRGYGRNRGGGGGGQSSGPSDQISVIAISGLYHSNVKTEIVDPDRFREFVLALADTPYFVIDKNDIKGTTLLNYTTSEADPTSFALKFTMQLKLREPISLKH
jgi:type IV pilus assembly protein PilM